MDRLETRELACFLAVADELHFGRAADRLGVAQPAVSRTIRQLESRLGVSLFERTSRAVALTAAGEVLAREGRHALDSMSAAVRRTRRAGEHLTLALKPGGDAGLLPSILAAYEGSPFSLPVRLAFEADLPQVLRDGNADAALLYRELDDLAGLDVEPLLTEPSLAVLPASHPLARRGGLLLDDLSGERLHRRPREGGNLAEVMQRIALGEVVAVLPRSLTTPLRDDLVAVPVTDIRPLTLSVAWPAHSTSPALAALVRAAVGVSGA